MVVPAANGYDLLKEHAWYEYGNEEFQSVLNFDYLFAQGEVIDGKNMSYQLVLITIPILILFGLLRLYKSQTEKRSTLPLHQKKFELAPPREESFDLESSPGLSYSQSPTPTNSPQLSKEFFTNFETFRLVDDSHYKTV